MKRPPSSRGVWMAFAILLLAGAAAFRTTSIVVGTTTWVEHTHEVIGRLEDERAAVAEAEAARRAHFLTGDELALAAYAGAVKRLRAAGVSVRALTVDNPSQQRRLDQLEPLIDARIEMLAVGIERKQRNAHSPELEIVETRAGVAATRQIFAALSDMTSEELSLLAVRRDASAEGVAYLRVIQAVAMLVSFGILLVAFRRLRREVLARVVSERLAHESEASLSTTLMSIGDGVIATDAEGRVIRINLVAETLTGWSDGTAIGRPSVDVFRVVHEETRAITPSPVEAALRRGEVVALANHTLLLRKDGTDLPIADSCAPVRDAEGKIRGAVLVFRDVSQEQRAKRDRERAQRQIMASERMASVGTLAAGVAHEINNPLAFVSANLDMIVEEARSLSEGLASGRTKDLEDMALEARQGAERIRKIVRGLSAFTRADEERRTVIDVKSTMEQAIHMAANEIRQRARLVEDYGEIPLVDADEARLGQVFVNLLINAAQAVPEGDATANEIRVATRTDSSGRAVIEVRDTGRGILPEVLGRVFDPFFTTKAVGLGTGLGLSICHNIVTAMGGEITATSELGQGATFRVVLPASSGQLAEGDHTTISNPPSQLRRAAIVNCG